MLKIFPFKAHASKLIMCGALSVSLLSLSACDLAKNQLKPDREGSLETQDYKDALSSRVTEPVTEDEANTVNIPELQPYIASKSEDMKSMPLVSLSVNQSVPLKDILFELAKQAEYDLELDPNIRGSIIFTAKNRPFDQVVKRIADIAGLRYNFEDDVLRVELDTQYNELYKIDYLSYIRRTTGGIRNDVNVVSGEGSDTGSNFEASSESEIDFWAEIETNLGQIVGGESTGALKTNRDPQITVAEQNPNVESTAGEPVAATLNVQQIPDTEEPVSSNDGESLSTFTINKQAGIISVFATEKEHIQVTRYLKEVEKAVTSQVLIEAKILEVTLRDEYNTGVNWDRLDFLSGELQLDFNAPASNPTTGSSAAFTLGYTGNDVSALIDALSSFGTVKALASPRLTVINNQSAVMNVANNIVYFDIDVDSSVETEGAVTTRDTEIDAEIRNVPEGVLVNVQPSIDNEMKTISLAIRPTITRVTRFVPNPAIQFITAEASIENVESLVPELNVQEVDSVIKVNSGQPIVMGGLLQDRVDTETEAVPILGEVPVIGGAFRSNNDQIEKTELVIFLKATILDSPLDSVHNTDKDLYRQFSGDRRPLRF